MAKITKRKSWGAKLQYKPRRRKKNQIEQIGEISIFPKYPTQYRAGKYKIGCGDEIAAAIIKANQEWVTPIVTKISNISHINKVMPTCRPDGIVTCIRKKITWGISKTTDRLRRYTSYKICEVVMRI